MTRPSRFVLAAIVALLPTAAHAQASPTPAASASASPGASPSAAPVAVPTLSPAAIDKLAREEFEAWRLGVVDRTRYSPQVTDALTEAMLTNVHTGLTAEGEVRSFTPTRSVANAGFVGYTYMIVAAHGHFTMNIAVDDDGLISGLHFTPVK